MKKSESYFEIIPDYGTCLGIFSVDNCSYGCEDDTLELEGYEDTPFIVPGLTAWCDEWAVDNDKWLECYQKREPLPSNDDWIKRGLDIAQKLRQIIPDEINLYFRKGTESVLIEKITYFALSPDTPDLIGDTNLYGETFDSDLCEIANFMPFLVPGLSAWWNDFNDHVDYTHSTADADFDWMSWIVRSLEMAKVIRKNLPSSVEVWFRTPFEIRNIFPLIDVLINEDGSLRIADFKKRNL